MKVFWKMLLAVICGIFIMGIVGFILLAGMVGSMSSGSSKPVVPRDGVLALNNLSLSDKGGANTDFSILDLATGSVNMSESVGIWNAVRAIEAAASDPSIKFIYMNADNISASMSLMEELRKALAAFRASGKAVVAFTENPSTGSYYLASVADKVYMSGVKGASPMIFGVGTQMIFLKDLLDKLGVNMQLIRHGKYKSAGEMYIKNAPSAENMEQNQEMIDSIWESMSSDIASSRDFSAEELSAMIENLSICSAQDMVDLGLADELLDREGLRNKIADLAGKEKYKDVKFISLADYAAAKVLPNVKAKNKIAIIYAEGEIVEAGGGIVGDKMAATIRKVREDESVKAVVFRVNSPGGSVIASDKIKAEIDLLRAEKPVVASYGDYAASGGYWISNSCDRIFTDKTTLTGSIGVFSMIPDLSKTVRDIAHVNMVTVGSSSHSDVMSGMRPLSESETEWMQKSIEDIYSTFVGIVAEGRDMTTEAVDDIAQGRVWAGAEALGIGLVDEIGGLDEAVAYTASLAGDPDLKSWNIEAYPKPKSTMDQVLEMLGQGGSEASVFAGTPFEAAEKSLRKSLEEFSAGNKMYARMPYEIVIR